MTQNAAVGRVVTISLYNTKTTQQQLPLIEEISPAHFLLRIPIFLEGEGRMRFVGKEYMLRRAVLHLLRGLNIKPGIFHVRYLDNGSKAMIDLAEELPIPVVATLTPDPHRSVTDRHGEISHASIAQAIDRIHHIYIGDYIASHVQGLLCIGGSATKKDLVAYFPQLLSQAKNIPFRCIPEGVPIGKYASAQDDYLKMLTNKALKYGLREDLAHRPFIINAGRFNEVKGQDRLLKAWGDHVLWEHYNLLFIGGNFKKPNAEEQKMFASINNYLSDHAHLKGRFCLLSARNNKIVRQLERAIANQDQADLPTLYVCSSLKEEFGISIIEAMAAGLVVMAPKNGGAHSYIQHGENGFLIETQSAQEIYQAIDDILFGSPLSKEKIGLIQQKAQQTIERNFSIQQISESMVTFYQTVRRAPGNEL